MTEPDVRTGMPAVKLDRAEFEKRYRSRFIDHAFKPLSRELDAIIGAAWDAYSHSRKSPETRKAGPGFDDPDYEIAVDWLNARQAIEEAQRCHDDAKQAARILIINGSSRSEHTCPGEMSKTWRLVKLAEPVFGERGFEVDILDLSRTTSEFGKQIHPCKSCVSTSMAFCHWPAPRRRANHQSLGSERSRAIARAACSLLCQGSAVALRFCSAPASMHQLILPSLLAMLDGIH